MTDTVMILGGTSGLGKELANFYRANGARVLVIGRKVRFSKDPNYFEYPCELSELPAIEDLVRGFQIEEIQLKRFFWVAGIRMIKDFATLSWEGILRCIDVNFRNSMLVANWAWFNLLKNASGGSFTVVSSRSGLIGRAQEEVYCATKFAQIGFARSLGEAAARQRLKIKVSLFNPGGMKTDFWKGARPDDYDSFLEPAKVAALMVKLVNAQTDPYLEKEIPRGSL